MIENRLAKIMGEKKLDSRDIVKITGLDNHTVSKLYKESLKELKSVLWINFVMH